jgi:rRNA maturation protein Nop10
MAHLWIKPAAEWEVQALTAAQYELAGARAAVAEPGRAALGAGGGRLVRAAAGDPPAWMLLAGDDAAVRVNGRAPVAGACVLEDRDEIRAGGAQFYFSTETLAAVETFAGGDGRRIHCCRCHQEIAPGAAAVRCPGCGVFYHQTEQLPCYTYAATCAQCGQDTSLQAGFRFVPEE